MSNITNASPVVTEDKLTEFYNDIKPFLGCPAYVTQEGDEMYFSSSEKVVGRWVDGKPLYVKTITLSNFPNSGESVNQTGLMVSDVTIIYSDISASWPDGEQTALPYYSISGNQYCIQSSVMPRNGEFIVRLQASMDRSSLTGRATIYYTKTADSAVTTIEQKPTHYSTDEQVVGTWIDGRPIYQKTFTNLSITTQGEWIAFNHNISNFDDLIQVCSCNVRREGQSDPWIHSVGLTIGFDINKTQFEINSQIPGTAKLTIQYTKTTD